MCLLIIPIALLRTDRTFGPRLAAWLRRAAPLRSPPGGAFDPLVNPKRRIGSDRARVTFRLLGVVFWLERSPTVQKDKDRFSIDRIFFLALIIVKRPLRPLKTASEAA